MKKFLILTSILGLVILAALDTHSIMEEIAAITPTEVEMKPQLNSSGGEGVEKKFESRSTENNNLNMQNGQNNDKNLNVNPMQHPQKGISPTLTPRRY